MCIALERSDLIHGLTDLPYLVYKVFAAALVYVPLVILM